MQPVVANPHGAARPALELWRDDAVLRRSAGSDHGSILLNQQNLNP
jgi:hypothetical protein